MAALGNNGRIGSSGGAIVANGRSGCALVSGAVAATGAGGGGLRTNPGGPNIPAASKLSPKHSSLYISLLSLQLSSPRLQEDLECRALKRWNKSRWA